MLCTCIWYCRHLETWILKLIRDLGKLIVYPYLFQFEVRELYIQFHTRFGNNSFVSKTHGLRNSTFICPFSISKLTRFQSCFGILDQMSQSPQFSHVLLCLLEFNICILGFFSLAVFRFAYLALHEDKAERSFLSDHGWLQFSFRNFEKMIHNFFRVQNRAKPGI